MLKIKENVWAAANSMTEGSFEEDIKKFDNYYYVLNELYCNGLLDDEWEDIEERLVYSFILRCFIEVYGNHGKRGENINYVCEFIITEARKVEFGLFTMWEECMIYDLVNLIKDMWERYLFELKRDLDK